MVKRRLLASAALLSIGLAACDVPKQVTVYPVNRIEGEWSPGAPMTYRMTEDGVVELMGGFVEKYEDCVVFAAKNWKCTLDDGATFGVRDGAYWRADPDGKPGWGELIESKYVSSLDWNLIRCEELRRYEKDWFSDCISNWK